MSITSDKQSIFDSVTSVSSLSNSLSTINNLDGLLNNFDGDLSSNTKDITSFLVLLLSTMTSVQEVKDLIRKIITSNTGTFNTLIKQQLLSEASVLDNISKPQQVTMNIGQIDPFGNLKNRSSSNLVHKYNKQIGGQIYAGLDGVLDNNSFVDSYFNYTFDSSNNLVFKPSNPNITKYDLITNIINGTNFIDGNLIYTEIINLLFGSLYSINNENSNKILNKELFNKYLKNALDKDSVDDTIFSLSEQDLSDLQKQIDKKNNGNSFDFDCSDVNVFLTLDDVNSILNSNDPLSTLSNKVNNNVVDSDLNVKYTVDSKKLKREQFLKNNQQLNSKMNNKNAIDTKLNNDIIKSLAFIIIKNAITSPQYLIINNLLNCYVSNQSVYTGGNNMKDIMSENSKMLNCIIKTLKNKLVELIYNYVYKSLKRLINPVLVNILKEKASAYLAILESLGGF